MKGDRHTQVATKVQEKQGEGVSQSADTHRSSCGTILTSLGNATARGYTSFPPGLQVQNKPHPMEGGGCLVPATKQKINIHFMLYGIRGWVLGVTRRHVFSYSLTLH